MSDNLTWHQGAVGPHRRAAITGGPGATIWLTGLSASGKSTVAVEVERLLIEDGRAAYVLDGDNVRHGLNADLGFAPADRAENVRRVGEVALLLADAGVVAIAPLISPYAADRARVAARHRSAEVAYHEVFVDTPLSECERRDPKGLYAMARKGELAGFTGVDAPYERPVAADLVLDTMALSVAEAARLVAALVR